MIRIKKGLNVPITGVPQQTIYPMPRPKKVAVTGSDYIGMKPSMLVKEGDQVKVGQALFECKKTPGVVYTAPAAGTVMAINRGAKRIFQNIVIQVNEQEEHTSFAAYSSQAVSEWSEAQVRKLLIESGLWTAIRTRPYSKVPNVDASPAAFFITATDSQPLAPSPELIIDQYKDDFKAGVEILSKLTTGKTYICKKTDSDIPAPNGDQFVTAEFDGVHPYGNVGTHIHFLEPVHINKFVWHMSYQDVIAVGKLFSTGKLWTERIISIAGPQIKDPKLLRVRLGHDIDELTKDQIKTGATRLISGSVLNGRKVVEPFHFLGRYHLQVTGLEEGHHREFLGWHSPGLDKFSLKRTFISKLIPSKRFNFDTNTHGSHRSMVPVGMYESVMPMDILPTQLLRALLTRDTDLAQELGCLELDEEDLALCTFASIGKKDFGHILRENLTMIEKEG